MQANDKEPFIPLNKPKSWVIFVLSCLAGLLIAGPIIFLGAYLEIGLIKGIGITMFVACWASSAVTAIYLAIGMFKGKYRNMKDREWRKQLW